MSRLSVICASSLAGGEAAFSTLGDVTVLPESAIDAASIRGASILATRSKVKVNDRLLAGSAIAFYGTATAGTDHVDAAALESRGIAWASAPGSNANSVAEYIIASLARIGIDRGISWRGKTIGIIGAGHVGSRLHRLARVLGMQVTLHDPPLFEKTGDPAYRTLAEILPVADVISLHVPLTDEGPYATRGMAGRPFFSMMKRGAIFMNASRGEVVHEPDLLAAARTGAFDAVVLDVFHHEPDINPDVLGVATLASPHIAGYSLDARLNGTAMIYRAACDHFGVGPAWHIPRNDHPAGIKLESSGHVDEMVYHAVLKAYDPAVDDRQLRGMAGHGSIGRHFQHMRLHYAERREFANFQILASADTPARAIEMLAALGFMIKPATKPG